MSPSASYFLLSSSSRLFFFSSLSFYRAHSDVIGRLNNRGPTSLIVLIINSRTNEVKKKLKRRKKLQREKIFIWFCAPITRTVWRYQLLIITARTCWYSFSFAPSKQLNSAILSSVYFSFCFSYSGDDVWGNWSSSPDRRDGDQTPPSHINVLRSVCVYSKHTTHTINVCTHVWRVRKTGIVRTTKEGGVWNFESKERSWVIWDLYLLSDGSIISGSPNRNFKDINTHARVSTLFGGTLNPLTPAELRDWLLRHHPLFPLIQMEKKKKKKKKWPFFHSSGRWVRTSDWSYGLPFFLKKNPFLDSSRYSSVKNCSGRSRCHWRSPDGTIVPAILGNSLPFFLFVLLAVPLRLVLLLRNGKHHQFLNKNQWRKSSSVNSIDIMNGSGRCARLKITSSNNEQFQERRNRVKG